MLALLVFIRRKPSLCLWHRCCCSEDTDKTAHVVHIRWQSSRTDNNYSGVCDL